MESVAARLAKHGLAAPTALAKKPRLNNEQHYLTRQFMVLNRTRGQGINGPLPITLGEITHFLNYWPQFDSLKFVETMLAADQQLAAYMATEREGARNKNHG